MIGEKDTTVIVRMSSSLKKAIQIAAAQENRNMTNFIETMLLESPKIKKILGENLNQEVQLEIKQENIVEQGEVVLNLDVAEKKEQQDVVVEQEQSKPDVKKIKHHF